MSTVKTINVRTLTPAEIEAIEQGAYDKHLNSLAQVGVKNIQKPHDLLRSCTASQLQTLAEITTCDFFKWKQEDSLCGKACTMVNASQKKTSSSTYQYECDRVFGSMLGIYALYGCVNALKAFPTIDQYVEFFNQAYASQILVAKPKLIELLQAFCNTNKYGITVTEEIGGEAVDKAIEARIRQFYTGILRGEHANQFVIEYLSNFPELLGEEHLIIDPWLDYAAHTDLLVKKGDETMFGVAYGFFSPNGFETSGRKNHSAESAKRRLWEMDEIQVTMSMGDSVYLMKDHNLCVVTDHVRQILGDDFKNDDTVEELPRF